MTKTTKDQIESLEEKLQQLKAAQIVELKEQLRTARQTVAELEQEIARLSGKPISHDKRKRTSSAEIRERIQTVLQKAKDGLSQKQISERSGINYQTVALYLRKNQ